MSHILTSVVSVMNGLGFSDSGPVPIDEKR
jgi:hypothetical protein